jgi:hypothetical protein
MMLTPELPTMNLKTKSIVGSATSDCNKSKGTRVEHEIVATLSDGPKSMTRKRHRKRTIKGTRGINPLLELYGSEYDASRRRRFQVDGFVCAIHTFLRVYGVRCESAKLFQHLFSQMKDSPIDQLAAVFKLSLATLFSKETRQELPEDSCNAVSVFPNPILRRIRSLYRNEHRKLKILWDLMQSKALCNDADESAINRAYEKHRKVLATIATTPQPVLSHLRQYAREFAKEVSSLYNNKTYLAPTKGYVDWPRIRGGCRRALEPKLKFSGGLRRVQTVTRIDPVTIYLYGPPGIGKSYLSSKIISKLSKIFGYNYNNCYQRSIATKHWDGYKRQLICQIDDIFSSADDGDDCLQVIQICSNADCVLPMADLREKGTKFNSEFLILSSNNTNMGRISIVNMEAVLRRITPAYNLKAFDKRTRLYTLGISIPSVTGWTEKSVRHLSESEIVKYIIDDAIDRYHEHVDSVSLIDEVSYDNVFQPIVPAKIGEYGYGYNYPARIPKNLPRCQALAVLQPLKIRMITKGEPDTWILKPLQKAMFGALKKFQIFDLTSGKHIDLHKLSLEKPYLVSGDYESATDNLHMDVMEVVVDELVKVLPKTIVPWILRESGSHIISYPSETGLCDLLQTNGQLMGSLLSFPILCVANAASIGIAQKAESLHDVKALINGDDILFAAHPRQIKIWKWAATSLGLKPSIGKNFISSNWATVNSQLIARKGVEWRVIPTGKFACLYRKPDGPLTITTALSVFSKPQVVRFGKNQLARTPRSIDISTDFGGLGLETTKKPTKGDMEVYLYDLLNRRTVVELFLEDKALVRAPREIIYPFLKVDLMRDAIRGGQYPPPAITYSTNQLYDDDPITSERQDIFDWLKFIEFKKFYKSVPALREFVKRGVFLKPLKDSKMIEAWVDREIAALLPTHLMI